MRRSGLASHSPPLSQQIRDLEEEIGTRLFVRSSQGASLTDAGMAFLQRVSEMPRMAQDAAQTARAAAAGMTGHLRLGLTGTVVVHPLVPHLIRTFRSERPEVQISLIEANSVRLQQQLLDGAIDLAIVRTSAADPPELDRHPIASEALLAAVPATDWSADTPSVALKELAAFPLILTPRSAGISLHDAALAAFHRAGLEPVLGQQAPQIMTILALVSAGLGYALLPSSIRRLPLDGVLYKDISDDVPQLSIAVSSKTGAISTVAQAFLQVVSQSKWSNP